MKLVDLNPEWIDLDNRKGLGFLLSCPKQHCKASSVIFFANPLDDGPAFEGDAFKELVAIKLIPNDRQLFRGCGPFRWNRDPKTKTFETLTLSPSVNAHECGHYHIIKGQIVYARS